MQSYVSRFARRTPLPQPTDEFDKNSLPDPELNPLLNPLLAAHMGRWAEVYFTNPPEKRGQAVAELIRELQSIPLAEPDAEQVASVSILDEETGERREMEMAEAPNTSSPTLEPGHTCGACGYDNSPGQRFCGMCGEALLTSPPPQVEENVVPTDSGWNESESSHGSEFVEYENPPAIPSAARESEPIPEPAWALPQESLPRFAVEAAPSPYRYRLYVGAVVAILLTVLVYMAWRGSEALSSNASSQPTLPAAVPAVQPAPAASTQQSAKPNVVAEDDASSVQSQSQRQPDTSRKEQGAAPRPAAEIVPVSGASPDLAIETTGAEDLATAEKYLTGSSGTARNSSEAAEWMWKAMGKGNVAAMMALADLYLKGDGVTKSCDQAHVLLDAAARKGSRAAAERLRHLQAFGCE